MALFRVSTMVKTQNPSPRDEAVPISRAEILARLRDRALALVDVMPADSFKAAHIPGSVNLPVADIESEAARLLANHSQEIAIYCAGPA